MKYSLSKRAKGSFQELYTKVKEALTSEEFGILTEINVSETLKKKLHIPYPPYLILGVCHPQSAYQALKLEKEIGLLLPCNVILYTDKTDIVISAIRPTVSIQVIENPKVLSLAKTVEEKLKRVIEKI